MKRRTKIVCTIGPSSGTPERIAQLIAAGMNVARINCSHGDWETRNNWISLIRKLSPKVGRVGILIDLQGPKFRLGAINPAVRELEKGEKLLIGMDETIDLPIPSPEICEVMDIGDRVLLGDGDVELLLVAESRSRVFEAQVLAGGTVKSKQGVTLVGKVFHAPPLTEKDLKDLDEVAKTGCDIVALSYVNQASDIRELRRYMEKIGLNAAVCAKIETKKAVQEIDEILKVVDVIMVARGDLGLQMDLEDVPITQKHLIKKCNAVGKPVITATQMLESMVHVARPTRAEATDVANAILDGTDAVMLSGETATGAYPVEAVNVMGRIAETAEDAFDYERYFEESRAISEPTSAVAEAAVQLAQTLKANAILTTSTSGLTPRMVSKFRPKSPILCTSWTESTHGQMSVVWGVNSIHLDSPNTTDDVIQKAIDGFLNEKLLNIGDTVIITAGVPAGLVGNTNLILVETVK